MSYINNYPYKCKDGRRIGTVLDKLLRIIEVISHEPLTYDQIAEKTNISKGMAIIYIKVMKKHMPHRLKTCERPNHCKTGGRNPHYHWLE